MLETLNTTETKKLALRIISTMADTTAIKVEIGRHEGFKKILRLLIEGDAELTQEILRTFKHLADSRGGDLEQPTTTSPSSSATPPPPSSLPAGGSSASFLNGASFFFFFFRIFALLLLFFCAPLSPPPPKRYNGGSLERRGIARVRCVALPQRERLRAWAPSAPE